MKAVVILSLTLVLGFLAKTQLHGLSRLGAAALPQSIAELDEQARAGGEHFSPDENLERLDVLEIRQAHSTIDIAMYAFTDRALAKAISEVARQGVQIRLYRDQEQFESEQSHSMTSREPSTTQMLLGSNGIHIRVKQAGFRDYMHCKQFLIDGKLLRDGSANWSKAALQFQDNSWLLVTDPLATARFGSKFQEMWTRPSNLVIQ